MKVYTIKEDFTIDVDASVWLYNIKENELPEYIQFGNISYNFGIYDSNIKSLRGFPKRCGDMGIKNCPNLRNLDGLGTIQHKLSLTDCSKLTSLKGGPNKSCAQYYIYCCDSLESLEYVPQVVGDFRCVDCPKITSLEGLKKVIGELVAVGCGKSFTNKYLEKLNIE